MVKNMSVKPWIEFYIFSTFHTTNLPDFACSSFSLFSFRERFIESFDSNMANILCNSAAKLTAL